MSRHAESMCVGIAIGVGLMLAIDGLVWGAKKAAGAWRGRKIKRNWREE